MTHTARNLIAATLLAGATTAARAEDCSCNPNGNPATTLVRATTTSGRLVQMLLPANPVNSSLRTASVCASPDARLTLAKLWMPDMGHGSASTRLTAITPSCTKVERIAFVMPGAWDIQVAFDGGDTATLKVVVE